MATTPNPIRNLRHRQQLLAILIFSLVTICFWVAISLITSQQQTTISPELQRVARPLNPNINTDVLEQIEAKRTFTVGEMSQFPVYRLLTEQEVRQSAAAQPSPVPAADTTSFASQLLGPSQVVDDTQPAEPTPGASPATETTPESTPETTPTPENSPIQ